MYNLYLICYVDNKDYSKCLAKRAGIVIDEARLGVLNPLMKGRNQKASIKGVRVLEIVPNPAATEGSVLAVDRGIKGEVTRGAYQGTGMSLGRGGLHLGPEGRDRGSHCLETPARDPVLEAKQNILRAKSLRKGLALRVVDPVRLILVSNRHCKLVKIHVIISLSTYTMSPLPQIRDLIFILYIEISNKSKVFLS